MGQVGTPSGLGLSGRTHVIPFFAFPPEARRVIYTTNALESVYGQLRKIIKTRGHFLRPRKEGAVYRNAGRSPHKADHQLARVCNQLELALA